MELVRESEFSAKVRHLNVKDQMAGDETMTFFPCFLLLIFRALRLQNSETLPSSTSKYPASSNETIKPSTSSSSVSSETSALLEPEFERIRNKHPVLASTGCTRDFCQSGRMIHTDEPRGTYILKV